MFSAMFAVLFLAALSVVTNRERERREDRAAGGRERCDREEEGRNGSLPFELNPSGRIAWLPAR
jgi:hypothetical protein